MLWDQMHVDRKGMNSKVAHAVTAVTAMVLTAALVLLGTQLPIKVSLLEVSVGSVADIVSAGCAVLVAFIAFNTWVSWKHQAIFSRRVDSIIEAKQAALQVIDEIIAACYARYGFAVGVEDSDISKNNVHTTPANVLEALGLYRELHESLAMYEINQGNLQVKAFEIDEGTESMRLTLNGCKFEWDGDRERKKRQKIALECLNDEFRPYYIRKRREVIEHYKSLI